MATQNYTKPIELVLSKLDHKRSGSGYVAKCPAHEDSTASLSISEANDRRVLLHCHAGCKADSICQQLGIKTADLFPAECRHNSQKSRKNEEFRRQEKPKKSPISFATAEEAIADYEQRLGKAAAQWSYHNAVGERVGMVLRWNLPNDKKDIRPIALIDGHWLQTGMPAPRPLYNLPLVMESSNVCVFEGEKCCDAAAAIGIIATTSPHGSRSANKADWSPLAGKSISIFPDNDDAGRKYANEIIETVTKLSPQPTVRVVELPGLGAKEDIVDWLDRHDAVEPDDLRQQLESIIASTEPITLEAPLRKPSPLEFKPFPTNQLPMPLNTVVERIAKAIGCDHSFVALPLLAMLASIIGCTRRLVIKGGWVVPAILWAVIIGYSGSSKTPALKEVLKPLRKRQRKAMEIYEESLKQFEIEVAHYKIAYAAWEKKNQGEEPPRKPEPPFAERCLFDNVTVEALLPILLTNPRQPMLMKDELSGWFAGFDAYRGGKGGDESFWLSAFNGEPHINDRKTGIKTTIYLPYVCLSVTGGIQPEILKRHLNSERRESGLAARLLLAYPPQKPKVWTDAEIDSTVETLLESVVNRLFSLDFQRDADGRAEPVRFGMSPEAKQLFISYYNRNAQEQADLTGDMAAAWSKLEEYAARIALVLHYVRWSVNDFTLANDNQVDADSMQAAIVLTEWFKHEAKRVYSMLHESDVERELRRLAEWIGRKGGSITPRDLQRLDRRYSVEGAAEDVLEMLVQAHFGEWDTLGTTTKGGRPSRRFVLSNSAVDETPEKPEKN